MTERGPWEPLPPDEEAAVARLLADAGGPVTMPPEVAARLDDVLAELERERAEPSEPSPPAAAGDVVTLAARRRWPRLVLAAAAVVVGGYGVGAVLGQGSLSGGDSGAGSAASDTALEDLASRERPKADDDAGARADQEAAPMEEPQSAAEDRTKLPTSNSRRVRLDPDRLEDGVRRALRVLEREEVPSLTELDSRREQRSCPAPELADGERALRVRYDGEPAVLVAAPPDGGLVEVTIHACDGTELDSAVVER